MTSESKNIATGIAPPVRTSGAMLTKNIDDYPAGIVIPVDKPYTWTSADVIRKIKFAAVRHFGKRNLKVGHAGTLDPLATGILLVCIGKATKTAEILQSHDKEYIAGIVFGATTPSYDREKDIDSFYPFEHITEEAVRETLKTFIGEQEQIAPLFSAKSVDGVRAYEIARRMMKRGETENIDEAAAGLIRSARIRIDSLDLLRFTPYATAPETDPSLDDGIHSPAANSTPDDGSSEGKVAAASTMSSRINVSDTSGHNLPKATVRIVCSKGTYIRAFARDLGEALGSGAFLDSLQRSRSGNFRIENAVSVEEVLKIMEK